MVSRLGRVRQIGRDLLKNIRSVGNGIEARFVDNAFLACLSSLVLARGGGT